MAIPRRYIWVAAGAAFTVGAMLVRNQLDKLQRQQREDDRDRERNEHDKDRSPKPDDEDQGAPRPEDKSADSDMVSPDKELTEFLAGDSWYDEAGWKSLWEREGIDEPAAWLKEKGLTVLKGQREALKDHPALLAGCRRRFIVVARYAGIDVSDAAKLWNSTDA